MTKTENLQLPQWEAEDYVQRSDFNDAFQALDEGYALAVGSASKAWEASAGKADAETVTALQAVVDTKAGQEDLTALTATVSQKAAQTDLTALRNSYNTEIVKRGNCQLVIGSYTGTGKYGKSNAITLSFDYKPVFLAVLSNSTYHYSVIRNVTTWKTSDSYTNTVTWGDRSISWYSDGNAATQQNTNGGTYYYAALLSMTD